MLNIVSVVMTNPIAFIVAWFAIYCIAYTSMDYLWPTNRNERLP